VIYGPQICIVVGTVVAGQNFYVVTVENLRQLGAQGDERGEPQAHRHDPAGGWERCCPRLRHRHGVVTTFFEVFRHKLATLSIVLLWQCVGHRGLPSGRERPGSRRFAAFGELSFLVGPSGCGKTTSISVIAGLLDRTAGELEVLGTRLDDLSDGGRVLFRHQNDGFVFQQYNLLPTRTRLPRAAPRPTSTRSAPPLICATALVTAGSAPTPIHGNNHPREG
jgi:ABC transporter